MKETEGQAALTVEKKGDPLQKFKGMRGNKMTGIPKTLHKTVDIGGCNCYQGGGENATPHTLRMGLKPAQAMLK